MSYPKPTQKKTAKKPAQTPLRVGEKVLIRSVTNFYTGKIEIINKDEIVLSSAAWIADTGRFSQALKTGEFSEVEPYPDGMLVSIGRGAVCDTCMFPFDLPRTVK